MKITAKIISIFCIVLMCLCCASCDSADNGGSANLFDFSFEFDGTAYTVPEKISSFTDNGWTFPDDFDDYDAVITPGNLKTTYLSKGDNWFNIEIFNNTESDLTLKECSVGRVSYNFSGDMEVVTAGGFALNGKTLDEVVAKYGEPFSQADYSLYTEIIYDKDPETGIYDRYTFRFDKTTKTVNYIDIIYFY